MYTLSIGLYILSFKPKCTVYAFEERSGSVVEARTLNGRVARRYFVVSLSKTLYPLLSTGSTQGVREHPNMTEKLLIGT